MILLQVKQTCQPILFEYNMRENKKLHFKLKSLVIAYKANNAHLYTSSATCYWYISHASGFLQTILDTGGTGIWYNITT
jgi:hypothetical protein